jgi:hypothetical protein
METAQDFIKRKDIEFRKENSTVVTKNISRTGKFHWKREAWVFMPQSNYDKKVFLFERLRRDKYISNSNGKIMQEKGAVEYRIGYFIVGKVGRANQKWVWGQFCPLIPTEDFRKLIKKAEKEKIII